MSHSTLPGQHQRRVTRRYLWLLLSLLLLFSSGSYTAAQNGKGDGLSLFLPAEAFASTRWTMSREQLDAIRTGKPDPNLILDRTTAEALTRYGVTLHPSIRVVEPNKLQETLWQQSSSYTLLAFSALTPRYRVLRIDEQHPLDTDLSRYAFAFPDEKPNYEPKKLTRFLISGVTAFTRLTSQAMDKKGLAWAASGIREYTRRADYFHTSNEVSFVPDEECKQSGMGAGRDPTQFCAKDSFFPLLTDLGLDVVELTGNHNTDYGNPAYLRTLKMYREAGMLTFGGGDTLDAARKPLEIAHNGNRIALIGCNAIGPGKAWAAANRPGAAKCDKTWLEQTIPALAQQNDVVIVNVQYLELDSFNPAPQQIVDFRAYAALGASVVIGTQAHMPMIMEFYAVKPRPEAFIHYGLGNLYFDELFNRRMFFMDELFVYDKKLLTVNLFTGIIEDYARPRPMNAEERKYLLETVLERAFKVTK